MIIVISIITYFFYTYNLKKNLLIVIPLILILFISFFEITKNTEPGKKLYSTFDNLIIKENNEISLNLKDEFFNSRQFDVVRDSIISGKPLGKCATCRWLLN